MVVTQSPFDPRVQSGKGKNIGVREQKMYNKGTGLQGIELHSDAKEIKIK